MRRKTVDTGGVTPHQHAMSVLKSFLAIGEVISQADEVRDAVVNIREGIPDEEWDALIDAHPLLEDLWCACVGLEDVLDRG